MIEVEKKFQPTEEQLASFLKDAEFLGEKNIHDIYYDYADNRLYKSYVYLRNRNGQFELKVGKEGSDDNQGTVYKEIDTEEEIKNYFQTHGSLKDFIEENLKEILNFKTNRRKYKKGDFSIDVDRLDYGYDCVEVELQVANSNEVKEAKNRIIKLAKEAGWEDKKLPSKRHEYFRIVRPEVYKEMYGE